MAPANRAKRKTEPWNASKQKAKANMDTVIEGPAGTVAEHSEIVLDAGSNEKAGKTDNVIAKKRKGKKAPGPDAATALEEEFFTIHQSKSGSVSSRHMKRAEVGQEDTQVMEVASKSLKLSWSSCL